MPGNNLSAATPIKFSLQLVKVLYNDTIYTEITNTKYEGEIKNQGDRVRVRTAAKITWNTYTKGMTLVGQNLNPTSEDLIIDQAKYFKFGIDDIDKLQNDIDVMNEYADNARRDMSELIDSDILTYGRKNVKGNNALGTDYNTGTIAVAAGTGVVSGVGTTFTAAMVGGLFTPVASSAITQTTTFYLVTAFTSATQITVQDLDGVTYTGGAIGAGTSFTIKAATALALTKTNVYDQLVNLGTLLSQALCPRNDRFLVANAALEGIIRQSPNFQPSVETAYNEVVKNGRIGRIANFNVVLSELVPGDNTLGYWFLAGQKEFIAFGAQITKVSFIDQANDPNSFVSVAKGLLLYGRKVFAGNRSRGAFLRATCS